MSGPPSATLPAQAPPQNPHAPYPPQAQYPPQGQYPQNPQSDAGNGLSVAGIICGAVGFLFWPVIFGPIGIILGIIAQTRKERLAPVAIGVSILGLFIGMLLGALMWG